MNKLIEVKNLSINFGHVQALKNISFSVYEGDYINIIGPNGAGKTTLIKAILGLINDYEGKVITHNTLIGYLPQKTSDIDKIFPATVKEIVCLGLLSTKKNPKIINNQDKLKIRNILHKLDIWELRNRKIGHLSGGQKQRVLLARALVNEPKILILDEPTSALDPEFKTSFYKILHKLNEDDNVTILHITHDINTNNFYNKILYINQILEYFGDKDGYNKFIN